MAPLLLYRVMHRAQELVGGSGDGKLAAHHEVELERQLSRILIQQALGYFPLIAQLQRKRKKIFGFHASNVASSNPSRQRESRWRSAQAKPHVPPRGNAVR